MTREQILKGISEQFKDDIIELVDRSTKRVYLEIKPGALARLANYIFKDLGARFNTASGVDVRQYIEIMYHFIIEEINLLITLRLKLDKTSPEVDSLTSLFEGANWIEREMAEMLNIRFKGHPDPRRLLLPENWPDGVDPLRRDYQEWDKNAVRDRGV